MLVIPLLWIQKLYIFLVSTGSVVVCCVWWVCQARGCLKGPQKGCNSDLQVKEKLYNINDKYNSL